jgi:hypothetical protein
MSVLPIIIKKFQLGAKLKVYFLVDSEAFFLIDSEGFYLTVLN